MGGAINLSRGIMKFEAEGQERGRDSWKGGSELDGLGEHCKLSQRDLGWSPDRFGRTKSPENASSAVNVLSSHFLIRFGRTLGGTRVEKHWTTVCV